MPGLGTRDVRVHRRSTAARIGGHCLYYRGVATLLRRNAVRIALAGVLVAVGGLWRGDGRKNEARAESPRELRRQPGPKSGHEALMQIRSADAATGRSA